MDGGEEARGVIEDIADKSQSFAPNHCTCRNALETHTVNEISLATGVLISEPGPPS